ncbi:hypothetical protein CMV_002945 [Castanea mollissima]|uniref:Uncharacterized protein n=1 Tax=Castanea mollissima TaxID=60419 RepID=A0A8J4S0C0_9ROSI|nr:hypothetical protein CMV_002945 [Castanea mollissima]
MVAGTYHKPSMVSNINPATQSLQALNVTRSNTSPYSSPPSLVIDHHEPDLEDEKQEEEANQQSEEVDEEREEEPNQQIRLEAFSDSISLTVLYFSKPKVHELDKLSIC